ncbi:MAG: MFS transporter [Hyphomicrobiaceae bacterium]
MPTRREHALLIVMLVATTSLSQFFRASTNVIAPRLITDLGLTPEMLGWANACFFLALLAVQIPVGILFDRIGARITVAALAVLAVAGSLMHASVGNGQELAAARFLLGVGHGGSFMATVFLVSRWYPRARWSTALSWVFAFSMLGIAAAGTPLALLSDRIGWRASFVLVAALSAAVGVLFLWLVRDDPPDAPRRQKSRESLVEAVRGFATILRLPGLWRALALQTMAYSVLATIMGLWAGPYLHDVHGFGPVERGNALILMATAQTLGVLTFGPLDRLFDSRKRVAIGGALATLTVLALLALLPQPSPAVAVGLLALLAAVSAYGVVVVSHCRSFYPEHLAGRGATTGNMAQLLGCSVMPIVTGIIAGRFPVTATGYAPEAYHWIFGTIGVGLACGLVIYLTARDIRPSGIGDVQTGRASARN